MTLLKEIETEYGTVRIIRSKRDGSMTYFQNGSFHSQSNKNGTSLCVYVHVIQEIILQARARDILIIGCAGGTLATMLSRHNCKITVVDINPTAFMIARHYFKLPHDVLCIRRDGIAYLKTANKKYDAVVIDVFGAHNTVPRKFTTQRFFMLLARVFSRSGLMIMNVMTATDDDRRAHKIARRAEAAGIKITLFDWLGQKDRNTLLVSSIKTKLHIPSGREPSWIKNDMKGISQRQSWQAK